LLDISDPSDYNTAKDFEGGTCESVSGIIGLEDIVEKLEQKHDVSQGEVRETLASIISKSRGGT
jgi:hypothetical protein